MASVRVDVRDLGRFLRFLRIQGIETESLLHATLLHGSEEEEFELRYAESATSSLPDLLHNREGFFERGRGRGVVSMVTGDDRMAIRDLLARISGCRRHERLRVIG